MNQTPVSVFPSDDYFLIKNPESIGFGQPFKIKCGFRHPIGASQDYQLMLNNDCFHLFFCLVFAF